MNSDTSARIKQVVESLGGTLLILALLIGISLIHPISTIIILIISTAIFLFICCSLVFNALSSTNLENQIIGNLTSVRKKSLFESVFQHVLVMPLLLCTVFIVTSFCIGRIWGELCFTWHPVANLSGIIHWALFLLDNIIRAVLFDFAETFHYKVGLISHTDNFYICSLIFLFRTTLSIAVISNFLIGIKIYKSKKKAFHDY